MWCAQRRATTIFRHPELTSVEELFPALNLNSKGRECCAPRAANFTALSTPAFCAVPMPLISG